MPSFIDKARKVDLSGKTKQVATYAAFGTVIGAAGTVVIPWVAGAAMGVGVSGPSAGGIFAAAQTGGWVQRCRKPSIPP